MAVEQIHAGRGTLRKIDCTLTFARYSHFSTSSLLGLMLLGNACSSRDYRRVHRPKTPSLQKDVQREIVN